jgi:hypothetical protein
VCGCTLRLLGARLDEPLNLRLELRNFPAQLLYFFLGCRFGLRRIGWFCALSESERTGRDEKRG